MILFVSPSKTGGETDENTETVFSDAISWLTEGRQNLMEGLMSSFKSPREDELGKFKKKISIWTYSLFFWEEKLMRLLITMPTHELLLNWRKRLRPY